MIGLKTYLAALAPLLGQTEEMLYERQRALVDTGLLERGSRGRGRGVMADERSLAPFLISLLSHDILALAFVAELFCTMRSEAGKCPFTGARNFREAIEAVLGQESLAERTRGVMVHRNHPGVGFISFSKKDQIIISRFEHKGLLRPFVPASALRTQTSFDRDFIRRVAKDIAQFRKDDAK